MASTSGGNTTAAEPDAPPAPKSVLFARGVIARLAIWPAMRLAVEQNWGGPESAQKRTWLASILVDAFEEQHPTPDAPYVEETLLQVMEDEFDTVLEDDSAESVARDVVKLWEEIEAGVQQSLLKFEEQADKVKGKTLHAEEAIGSDEEEEWESDDGSEDEEGAGNEAPMLLDQSNSSARPPKEEPEVDEDGFTTVKRKARR